MDPEVRSAIDGVIAALQAEVLRLHLKIRRQNGALDDRIKALESDTLDTLLARETAIAEGDGRAR
jgi:hypothetical protein